MADVKEGIFQTRDVFELVRKVQLSNIVAHKKREVLLCTAKTLQYGMGENILPTDVLMGVIETKDNNIIFGLIVNDFVLTTLSDKFIVAEDDESKDIIIVGHELVNRNDFPYEEQDITDQH